MTRSVGLPLLRLRGDRQPEVERCGVVIKRATRGRVAALHLLQLRGGRLDLWLFAGDVDLTRGHAIEGELADIDTFIFEVGLRLVFLSFLQRDGLVSFVIRYFLLLGRRY